MELTYETRRSSRRKKITITVERDCAVVVHAPVDVGDETIEKLVNSKRQWLFEKLHHAQKYQPLPHPPGKELVNGESALYLGRRYRIELVDDEDVTVRLAGKFLIPKSPANHRKRALRAWYIERAKEKILARVVMHSERLGVTYGEAKISDMRYRWGSCTPANNLNFNWRLIKAPMSVIDYVVIHELAHLIEPNHTPRFWNIVHAQITSVESAKMWLRENGQSLDEDV